jgi:hypothetical protein
MTALPDLWIATVAEVAEHTAALNLDARAVARPSVPERAYWVPRPAPTTD